MKQLKHVWFIAAKDLKLFAADRLALFFFILFPFIFVFIFSAMFKGAGSADQRLTLHVVSREGAGSISHQLIQAMETGDPAQLPPGQPQIIWDKDYARALQDVRDRKLGGFLAFPEDFTKAVMLGYGTRLEVVVDPGATNVRGALNGLAAGIAARVGSEQLATNTAVSLMVEQALLSGNASGLGNEIQRLLVSPAQPSPPLITFDTQRVGDVEAGNPANWVIPGYLVMFTFFAAAQSSSIIVRERQSHTLERLLASSARRWAILGGMFTGTVVKGLVQVLVFWTVGVFVFGMDMGLSPLGVIVLSVAMVLVSASFSIMLATLAKTEKSAGALGVLVSLVLAPLGGCWWPLFITPQWMQSIARVTPHGWANSGFNNLIVFGADFNSVIPNVLVLAGFAVVFAIIAARRFRTDAV
jgi:ABC-2 type transport system permease protein